MKNILIILLAMISITGAGQSLNPEKMNIIGVWILTDYNNLDKFEDIWEFKSDKIFNQLKYKADGGTTLMPDENGNWILEGNRLKITVTGEDIKGEQKLYDKAQIMDFEILKEGSDFVLIVVSDGGTTDGKTYKLRLTKK